MSNKKVFLSSSIGINDSIVNINNYSRSRVERDIDDWLLKNWMIVCMKKIIFDSLE